MKPVISALTSGALCIGLLSSGAAKAHDNAKLDATPSPHGGQVRMAGPYHLELVTKGSELTVYVTDHAGSSVPTKGATGTATVTQGASNVSVALKAERENQVKGTGTFNLSPETQVAVSLSFPGKRPELAQFTPMKKSAPGTSNARH